MTTITEDYVSFETAKLLKEKGFPQQRMEFVVTTKDCSFIVNGSQKVKECAGTKFPYYPYSKLFLYEEDWAVLPTLQMVMKWLREKYNIYISIQPDFPSDKDYKMCWCWSASILHENCIDTKGYQCYIETYEEATETAIKYCLENLI